MKFAFGTQFARVLALACTCALMFAGASANSQVPVNAAPSLEGATFVASAGIYRTQRDAQAVAKELRRMGDVNAQIARVQGMGETFYRVQLPAKDLEDAREQRTKIWHAGHDLVSVIYGTPDYPDLGGAVVTGTVEEFDGRKVGVRIERVTNEMNGSYLRSQTFEIQGSKGVPQIRPGQRIRMLVSELKVYALERDSQAESSAAMATAGASEQKSVAAQRDSSASKQPERRNPGQSTSSQISSAATEPKSSTGFSAREDSGSTQSRQTSSAAAGQPSSSLGARTTEQVPQCVKWGMEDQQYGYRLGKSRIAVIKNTCSFRIAVIGCVTAHSPGRRSATCSTPEPTVGALAADSEGRRFYTPASLAPGQEFRFVPLDGEPFSAGDQINDGSFAACPERSGGHDVQMTHIRRENTLYTAACTIKVPPPTRKSCVTFKVVPQTPECASTLWTNSCPQALTARVCRRGGSQGNSKCEALEFTQGSQIWSSIGGVCNSADTQFYVDE